MFVLGGTQRLAGFANVTNLPLRPAPMLARTVAAVAALSALSGGRVVLGAGGLWDRISDMGVPRLSPGDAVDAFKEGIILVKMLCGGGPPVTYRGRHCQVNQIDPAPVPAPAVWTGSVGRKSLAATGRVADGWIPGRAADWLSQRYRASRPVIDEAAAAAGRDPHEIRTIFNFPGQITDQPLTATRDNDGRWIGGSAGQWAEELTGAVLEHGAAGFMLFSPEGGTPDTLSLTRWAREIVPAIRQGDRPSHTRNDRKGKSLTVRHAALLTPCQAGRHIYALSNSARPGYSDCHAGQLPAHRRRGRASYPLAGRLRLT